MMTQEAAEVAIPQFEPTLNDVTCYLAGISFGDKKSREKSGMRHHSVHYVWWEGHLYQRKKTGVVVVVPTMELEKVMQLLHEELGHWDAKTTIKLVINRFWWPCMVSNATPYVTTCGSCQLVQGPKR